MEKVSANRWYTAAATFIENGFNMFVGVTI